MIAELHLHVQLLDRAPFHRTSDLQDRTTLRELCRVLEIIGFYQHVAANHILSLGVWTVVDILLFALDNLAGLLQRMPGVLDAALRAEVLKPRYPFLQVFLPLLM